MDEGNQRNGNIIKKKRDEIHSKVVRAGKRTYFFDVKAGRSNDLYITITESIKRSTQDGRSFYEKHKVFLYREDFEDFVDGLSSMLEFVESQPENKKIIKSPRIDSLDESYPKSETVDEDDQFNQLEGDLVDSYATNINFEDLEEQH